VKFSSIVGPVTYGLVSWLSRGDHRLAILMTGAFFVVGLALLMTVDVNRGRAAAMADGPDGARS
jgi:UMF1 family MFS transporter